MQSSMVARRPANQGEIAKRSGLVDKAAIIMMALDDERSRRIIGQLDREEIRRLGSAMAQLGRADIGMVEKTIDDFRAEVGRTGNIVGTAETTAKLLRRILAPEQAAEVMDEIEGPSVVDFWDKLAHVLPQTLASYLRGEHPQTVAVILARLPAEHAAHVLRLLPQHVAGGVSICLVRTGSVQPSVLSDVEQTLRREFTGELSRSRGPDSAAILAGMLDLSEKEVLERVMATLEQAEPQAAARVRRLMFAFEDIQRIDRSTFGSLISECPAERLPILLSSASPELRDMFLSGMSERAGKLLREEMETMPPPRRKAVEEAQAEIVALVKRLAQEGRVVILDQDELEERRAS